MREGGSRHAARCCEASSGGGHPNEQNAPQRGAPVCRMVQYNPPITSPTAPKLAVSKAMSKRMDTGDKMTAIIPARQSEAPETTDMQRWRTLGGCAMTIAKM